MLRKIGDTALHREVGMVGYTPCEIGVLQLSAFTTTHGHRGYMSSRQHIIAIKW